MQLPANYLLLMQRIVGIATQGVRLLCMVLGGEGGDENDDDDSAWSDAPEDRGYKVGQTASMSGAYY